VLVIPGRAWKTDQFGTGSSFFYLAIISSFFRLPDLFEMGFVQFVSVTSGVLF